jgi:hypothetical protein
MMVVERAYTAHLPSRGGVAPSAAPALLTFDPKVSAGNPHRGEQVGSAQLVQATR